MSDFKFWIKGFLLGMMVLVGFVTVHGQDAQWNGPNRNGVFNDTLLMREWPAEGPAVLFATAGIGKGFSSAVATKDRIYATGTKDTTEYLTCLDHAGKIIWQKPSGRCWIKSYPEARCTPTVDGERVYVLTGMDRLVCFHALTGAEIWSVDIHKVYNSSWDMFGVSESILMVDDKVIVTPAGETTTVIALDKMTGKLVWKSESLHAHRSNMSPVVIERAGKKYIITAIQTHMLGVDASDGKILWTYHYNFLDKNGDNATIFTNSPVYRDSSLWISNGWDVKSVMLTIAPDGKSVAEKFSDHTFDNQNHGVVLIDTFLYGSNFTGRTTGKWLCMNWNTGEITWIADFHNKGPIIAADGMLYCLDEKGGNMALVKADPKEFKVTSTFKVNVGTGPFWAHPSIYFGMLLLRHGDYLVAYHIRR
jgi:outer membrane protein assembly factor BamB